MDRHGRLIRKVTRKETGLAFDLPFGMEVYERSNLASSSSFVTVSPSRSKEDNRLYLIPSDSVEWFH